MMDTHMRSTLITACIIAIPLVTGLATYLLFSKSSYLADESKLISPSFFMILAVLFSLFGNLLATEMWNNINQTNQDIRKEVSNLRSLLRFSETMDENLSRQIQSAVYAYKDSAMKKEFEPQNYFTTTIPQSPLIKIFNVISKDTNLKSDNPFFQSFMKSIDEIRTARYDRLFLKDNHISKLKYALLFVFGILTQLAIAAVHRSSKPVLFFTVMLFSVGFSVTAFVIECLNWPYEYPYFITKDMFNLVA